MVGLVDHSGFGVLNVNVDALGFWFLKNELHQRLLRLVGVTNIRHRYLETEMPLCGDATVLTRTASENRSFPNARANFHLHKPSEPKAVFRLTKAHVNTASGYVFDAKNNLIADFASWSMSSLVIDRLPTPGRSTTTFPGGDMLFLGPQGYYHWLIEDFPAYLQARAHTGNVPTLIRRRSPQFLTDALDLLHAQVIEAPVSCSVDSLVFASKGAALFPNRVDVTSLRDFQSSLALAPSTAPRIYISRRDSSRFPENEADVEACVRGFGFEIVCLSSMKFVEQISLFAGAEIIVGPHGAGLANIVWSAEGSASLIEIMRHGNPSCFEELAKVADLDYSQVTSSRVGAWRVDVDSLAKAIQAASHA
jgi:capsular polysaccharide biosynthesis protein